MTSDAASDAAPDAAPAARAAVAGSTAPSLPLCQALALRWARADVASLALVSLIEVAIMAAGLAHGTLGARGMAGTAVVVGLNLTTLAAACARPLAYAARWRLPLMTATRTGGGRGLAVGEGCCTRCADAADRWAAERRQPAAPSLPARLPPPLPPHLQPTWRCSRQPSTCSASCRATRCRPRLRRQQRPRRTRQRPRLPVVAWPRRPCIMLARRRSL